MLLSKPAILTTFNRGKAIIINVIEENLERQDEVKKGTLL